MTAEERDIKIVLEVAVDEWIVGSYSCFERASAVRALERIAARKLLTGDEGGRG